MVADGQQTGGAAASVERMDPDDFPTGYRPCRELGHGSMGTVWLAWHQQAEGHCAVKVLSLRNDRRGSAERSFNREVRAMARLRHPNIIEVHDYGRTPKGSPFVAMEYAPAPACTATCADRGPGRGCGRCSTGCWPVWATPTRATWCIAI
ncbi:MAG: protein kinase [Myxococcales bacterium]|nr:protein kinase [Myxococcales bacterium]